MDFTLLTSAQTAYLRVRPNFKNDGDAADSLGIGRNSIKTWKAEKHKDCLVINSSVRLAKCDDVEGHEGCTGEPYQAFKASYQELMETMNFSIKNPAEFVDRALVPQALKRIHETLSMEITNETSAQKMGVITKTAETVLKTKGILAPDSISVFRVDTVVAEMLKAGEKFTPDYLSNSPPSRQLSPGTDPTKSGEPESVVVHPVETDVVD